jgi:hypothetical protein
MHTKQSSENMKKVQNIKKKARQKELLEHCQHLLNKPVPTNRRKLTSDLQFMWLNILQSEVLITLESSCQKIILNHKPLLI